uniref:Lysosomal-associated transmembrane protein 4B n=1 Tax=Plectus sambesii TaxID=2011161 RepID=A0A914VKV5_9BILA
MIRVQPPFDPNEQNYLCCCNYDIMTGAKSLASIYTVVTVFIAMCFIPWLYEKQQSSASASCLVVYLCFLLLAIATLGCLWYGLVKERERFLIPMLIFSIICFIPIVVIMVLRILSTISMPIGFEEALIIDITSVIYGICAVLLQYWFFAIFGNAYSHIKHKSRSPTGGNKYIQQLEQVYIAIPKDNPEPLPDDAIEP